MHSRRVQRHAARLLLVSSAVFLSGSPASPLPAQESATMIVPAAPNDNPTLTAEEVGKRFLKLISGLESRSDLSVARIKSETGVTLGRFPVPSENLVYYAHSQPLDDGWFFSINYSPASPGLKEGAELVFSNVRNNLMNMQSVCSLDFDFYHDALRAMGYHDTPIHGEIGQLQSWRYDKNDITISIIPQNVVAGESGRLCVKSIGTLN